MKSYISAIGIANPVHITSQGKIAEFMAKALSMNNGEGTRLKALYRASGIRQRYSVLEDYGNDFDNLSFYPNNEQLEPFPSVAKRMQLYKENALSLSVNAIRHCMEKVPDIQFEKEITHLITVSCTGMYAPGIDIEIIQELGLNTSIKRTAINFMGCYAAFNAIKIADAICKADGNAKVLVVCVELCSIHFQKLKDEDNILSNALFGDGAAAMLIQTDKAISPVSLSLEQFHCDLHFEGKQEMAWHIGDHGFEMKLSSYVPDIIKKGINILTDRLLSSMRLSLEDISYYAIHPGGKRILEVIEEKLGMSKEDNRFAYEVLHQYGNMSSPTILFVLESLMNSLKPGDQDKNILSLAFGPGLTLESMLLKVS